jgi:hypothetical protein
MDIETQKKILQYVLKGLVPPGIAYYNCSMRDDFSCLIHIVTVNDDGVYGLLDSHDRLYLLDWNEWYLEGGLRTFAMARKIEPVEIAE